MKPVARHSGFTLVEMLVVIAIVALLVGITLPTLKNMRGADTTLAATRQLLDDVQRARQFALSQRTTVYMVFCPSNFWNSLPPALRYTQAASNLFDKQLTGYTFVTLRGVGDQPGQSVARYLSPWRALPDGAFIPEFKFAQTTNATFTIVDPIESARQFPIKGFNRTANLPFPLETSPIGTTLPYIAFDDRGQLLSKEDEYIPLARGSVLHGRDANKKPTENPPSVQEQPPGNSTNAYSLIHIDWLTGRPRLERQEFK